MKKVILILALLLGAAKVWGQIPSEVTDVMDRCRAAMTNAAGLEYEMDMKAGLGPVAMKMHFVVADKGKLNRTTMNMKVLGAEITSESGFDGSDTWEIKHSSKGDTIIITRGDKRQKSDGNLAFDPDKKYRKAKMKLKEGYYDITFSEPIDKDNEAKSIAVKISSKNYTMRELRTSAHGVKATMTVTRIRIGLKDSHFKLDLSKYPDAVVIRR
ncbi:MAG: hypothetical protein J6X79_07645 [Bacteroidales bacterium]|nr:hypothetical protein [Bacteroidales bacterium]